MIPLLLSLALAADPFPFEKEEAELSAGIHEHELKAHVYRLAGLEFLGRKGDGGTRAAEHIADALRNAIQMGHLADGTELNQVALSENPF